LIHFYKREINSSQMRNFLLYKLKDKVNNTTRGFAFVESGYDTLDEQFNFVSVGENISQLCGGNGDPAKMVHFLAQAIYNRDDEVKHETGIIETDLNLSEASSTNETTLDECHSISSVLSPLVSSGVPSVDASSASVVKVMKESVFSKEVPIVTIEEDLDDQIRVEREEQAFSPVVSSPRSLSPSSFTIANLAAEMVNEIKAKSNVVKGKELAEEQKSGEKGPAPNEEVINYYEGRRNAKEKMDDEEYNKLYKPFLFGWKRECMFKEGYEIRRIYYMTPEAQSKRLHYPGEISKYLSETGCTNLSLKNFSLRKVFLGFNSQYELLRCSDYKTVKPSVEWKTEKTVRPAVGWKYEAFCDVVTKDGETRYKCLLCGNLFTRKGNFGTHVKVVHEPDVPCENCGKEFRPHRIKKHTDECKVKWRDDNANEVKTSGSGKMPQELSLCANDNEIKGVATNYSTKTISEQTISESVENQFIKTEFNDNFDDTEITLDKVGDSCEIIEGEAEKDNVVSSMETEVRKPVVINPLFDTEKSLNNAPCQIEATNDPNAKEKKPKTDVTNVPISMATLAFVSAEGTRVRMQVKVHAKLIKGMKKFGVRIGVNYKNLRFMSDGTELTGEEIAGEYDGAKIMVERK